MCCGETRPPSTADGAGATGGDRPCAFPPPNDRDAEGLLACGQPRLTPGLAGQRAAARPRCVRARAPSTAGRTGKGGCGLRCTAGGNVTLVWLARLIHGQSIHAGISGWHALFTGGVVGCRVSIQLVDVVGPPRAGPSAGVAASHAPRTDGRPRAAAAAIAGVTASSLCYITHTLHT